MPSNTEEAAQPIPLDAEAILAAVEDELRSVPIIDVHRHLFMPSLGKLGLWGIDELITYHYLEAELFRSDNMTPEHYFRLTKSEQADAIWRALFVVNAPVSEAARGVVAVSNAFGLPTGGEDLEEARAFFAAQNIEDHVTRVLEQVIYKWRNTRRTLAPILANCYRLLADDGRPVTREDIRRDVHRLFRSNFVRFTGLDRQRA